MVELYLIDYHKIIKYKEEALKRLSKDRYENAIRFKMEEDILRSIAGSLMMNKYLDGLDNINYNSYGKPSKEGYHFNLSHSGDFVLFALADSEVGADIEVFKKKNESLENYVLTEDEKIHLEDEFDFYRFWTSKESLMKYLGTGLSNKIKDIPALPLEGMKKYKEEDLYSINFDYHNYSISVTSNRPIEYQFKEIDIDDLL